MPQNTIVVGTDGSPGGQAAVAQAARLASALDARVVLVSAYSNQVIAPAPEAAIHSPDARAGAEDALRRAEPALRTAGVPFDTRVVCASAAEALVEVAELEGAEAIVVGSRGMRGARRLLGSVPNSVSHHAPCSVYIVKTD